MDEDRVAYWPGKYGTISEKKEHASDDVNSVFPPLKIRYSEDHNIKCKLKNNFRRLTC